MAYASKAGRARTDARNPQAQGVCDRCGIWHQLNVLQFQYDWRGTALQNLQLRVCPRCLDAPQQQLRSIIIPADPVPVSQPRTEPFFADETNVRYTYSAPVLDPRTGIPIPQGLPRATESGDLRVEQQTGEPPGGLNQEPGTDPTVPASVGGDDPGLPLGNTEVPKTGPL